MFAANGKERGKPPFNTPRILLYSRLNSFSFLLLTAEKASACGTSPALFTPELLL